MPEFEQSFVHTPAFKLRHCQSMNADSGTIEVVYFMSPKRQRIGTISQLILLYFENISWITYINYLVKILLNRYNWPERKHTS